MTRADLSSPPTYVFLFFLPALPQKKGKHNDWWAFATWYSLTYLQNTSILQCRQEQMALIMEEKCFLRQMYSKFTIELGCVLSVLKGHLEVFLTICKGGS